MSHDEKARRAVGSMTRDAIEHQSRTGTALPDTRAAEKHAAEIARRVDRKKSETGK